MLGRGGPGAEFGEGVEAEEVGGEFVSWHAIGGGWAERAVDWGPAAAQPSLTPRWTFGEAYALHPALSTMKRLFGCPLWQASAALLALGLLTSQAAFAQRERYSDIDQVRGRESGISDRADAFGEADIDAAFGAIELPEPPQIYTADVPKCERVQERFFADLERLRAAFDRRSEAARVDRIFDPGFMRRPHAYETIRAGVAEVQRATEDYELACEELVGALPRKLADAGVSRESRLAMTEWLEACTAPALAMAAVTREVDFLCYEYVEELNDLLRNTDAWEARGEAYVFKYDYQLERFREISAGIDFGLALQHYMVESYNEAFASN